MPRKRKVDKDILERAKGFEIDLEAPEPPVRPRVDLERDEQGRFVNKLTEDIVTEVSAILLTGVSIETTADYLGITRRTFYNWINRGKEEIEAGGPESLYTLFVKAVNVANAEVEVKAAKVFSDEAFKPGKWFVAKEFLARRNPARWSEKKAQMIELTGAEGGPIATSQDITHTVDIESIANQLTDTQLDALLSVLDGLGLGTAEGRAGNSPDSE